jgi:PAS domain S-box-containing protein
MTSTEPAIPLSALQKGPPPVLRAAPASPTAALAAGLELLCRSITEERPGLRAAIYLLDRTESRWELVVQPDIPDGWREFHRVPLGPESGACAAAVARRERAVVADVGTDPVYGADRFAARLAGLGACWASPLISTQGLVRGVLLVHAPRGRRPDPAESAALDRVATLAALVVEQHDRPLDLGASHIRWREIMEQADVGVVVLGQGGRIVTTNRAYCRLVGYPTEELQGREVLDLVHPEDQVQAARDATTLQGGAVAEVRAERRLVRRDGRVVWVRVTAALTGDPAGRPGSRVEFVQDISDRKRAETALARAQDDLAAAERAGSTGRWILDIRTGLLLWSREMFRIWGLDPVTRHPDLESALARVHPEDIAAVRAVLERAFREGLDIEGEYRIIRPDGGVAHVRYWGRPVVDQAGEIVEYVGTVRDTTEESRIRGQLQASLEERQALAARQLQARDEERRRIARELHETTVQQLVALRLNLAALEQSGTIAGASERAQLDESIALAERSMTELRTLSYLLHPPLLDEAGLEPAMRWYVQGVATRSGLNVQLELPENLGRFPREVETALFRMVQECLTNILRHAASPSAAIRVSNSSGQIVVEVQDWGRGMAAVMAGRPEVTGPMIGVGLAGMRERIQQLGGTLEIESAGRGTTVRAALPADPALASC